MGLPNSRTMDAQRGSMSGGQHRTNVKDGPPMTTAGYDRLARTHHVTPQVLEVSRKGRILRRTMRYGVKSDRVYLQEHIAQGIRLTGAGRTRRPSHRRTSQILPCNVQR